MLHATAACSTLRMAELRPQERRVLLPGSFSLFILRKEMSNSAQRPTKLGFRHSPLTDALATEVVKAIFVKFW